MCNSPSMVYCTKGDLRYRKCRKEDCRFTWRTQEVIQGEADELAEWFTRLAANAPGPVEKFLSRLASLDRRITKLNTILEEETIDEPTLSGSTTG